MLKGLARRIVQWGIRRNVPSIAVGGINAGRGRYDVAIVIDGKITPLSPQGARTVAGSLERWADLADGRNRADALTAADVLEAVQWWVHDRKEGVWRRVDEPDSREDLSGDVPVEGRVDDAGDGDAPRRD